MLSGMLTLAYWLARLAGDTWQCLTVLVVVNHLRLGLQMSYDGIVQDIHPMRELYNFAIIWKIGSWKLYFSK